MTIPTLSDLEASGQRRVRFRKGNKIRFWMDFSSWEGLPSNVDLFVNPECPHPGRVELCGRGYGVREYYGNGSIYLNTAELLGAFTLAD
jgi:hypothetical protein